MLENPVNWRVYLQKVAKVAKIAIAKDICKVTSVYISFIAKVAGINCLI